MDTETVYERERIQVGVIAKAAGSFARYALRRWYLLLFAVALGGAAGGLFAKWHGTRYTAACAYTIQAQNNSGLLNTALSLANTLGLGQSKSGPTAYDNNFFAGLMKSRRVVKAALLDSATVNGANDLLANHFFDVSRRAGKWRDGERLKDFRFRSGDIHGLTLTEDSVLSLMYGEIIDKHLAVAYDPSAPFNRASMTTPSRDFSVQLMARLLGTMSHYYTNTLLHFNLNNLGLTEKRVDSLAQALRDADARVARLRDNAQNVVRQEAMLSLNNAVRDQSLLNTQYAAAVSNYETAKAAVLSTSPILQVIDEPGYSVDVKSINATVAVIVGALLALIAALGLLAVVRLLRSA